MARLTALQQRKPTDETVCAALATALTSCGEARRTTQMYEQAVVQRPDCVPLLRALFMCHLQDRDGKQQQMVWRPADLWRQLTVSLSVLACVSACVRL